MAALTLSKRVSVGYFPVTTNTLTSADTITYVQGTFQTIEFTNTTAGAITVTLLGNAVSPVSVQGVGSVSVASGYPVIVPAGVGATVNLILDNVYAYLQGTSVAVTGGVGVTVQCLTN